MTKFNFFVIGSLCVVSAIQSMEKNCREVCTTKATGEIIVYHKEQRLVRDLAIRGLQHNPSLLPHGSTVNLLTMPRKRVRDTNRPIMSESTRQEVTMNIERIKCIKNLINNKGYFILDDAAIYLAQKTTHDTQEELIGFVEAIADKMLEAQKITLDKAFAQRAISTRKLLAEQVKDSTQKVIKDLTPIINSVQRQFDEYKKNNKEQIDEINVLRQALEKQSSSLFRQKIAIVLGGAALGVTIYTMKNDALDMRQMIGSQAAALIDQEAIISDMKIALAQAAKPVWEKSKDSAQELAFNYCFIL